MSQIEFLHVYVFEDENGFVKMGVAGNVIKRIRARESASAYSITRHYESPSCANAHKIEKAAHRLFADRRNINNWGKSKINNKIGK